MRQWLKLVVHFPVRLAALLTTLGAFYAFARVLLAHDLARHALDALHRWPQRKVASLRTVVATVCLPLVVFVAAAAAAIGVAYLGNAADRVELLYALLPLPLLFSRRWPRVAGLPAYAFLVALHEAVTSFNCGERQQSAAARVIHAAVWNFILPVPYSGEGLAARLSSWVMELLPFPHWAGALIECTRLTAELIIAAGTCALYAIALFCREPHNDGDELREAARNNDMMRMKLLLARGVSADATSEDGSTALHVCAQQALAKGAQLLLDHGADPNSRDLLGFTPLHWAVQLRREETSTSSRLDTIRVLLRHGSDPKHCAVSGTTPFAIAVRKENEAALEAIKEVIGSEQIERLASALSG